MACSADPGRESGQGRVAHPRGRGQGRADRLRAGTVPLAVFLPRRERRAVRPGRADSRPHHRDASRAWPRELGIVIVGSVFERRAAGVYHNTALVIDADGSAAGPLSQDAHPRRSAVLRKVLLHARRPGLPLLRHALRAHRARWSAGTSGIPKPRAWPRWRGAQVLFYPTAIGWHPVGEGASTARRSTTPGAPSSAPTPSPTECTWRR